MDVIGVAIHVIHPDLRLNVSKGRFGGLFRYYSALATHLSLTRLSGLYGGARLQPPPGLDMFGKGLPAMLKEYGLNYDKRRTKQGMQTNLTLKEGSNGDWLPKCDEPVTGKPNLTGNSRSFFACKPLIVKS